MSEISSDSDSSCGWTVINHEVPGRLRGRGCLFVLGFGGVSEENALGPLARRPSDQTAGELRSGRPGAAAAAELHTESPAWVMWDSRFLLLLLVCGWLDLF